MREFINSYEGDTFKKGSATVFSRKSSATPQAINNDRSLMSSKFQESLAVF